jgi:hypothetical protein
MLRLKARIRKWRAERKLKKSGYKNWAQYRHNRDPDIELYANDLDDFYKGYPYVYVSLPNPDHYAYKLLYDYGPGGYRYGYHEIGEWCNEHIRWNYRVDMHRVWRDNSGRYSFNDIGGYDIIFFAFKNEKDFTHFLLRWS